MYKQNETTDKRLATMLPVFLSTPTTAHNNYWYQNSIKKKKKEKNNKLRL